MFDYEELACVKDFTPHFDDYTKMQNWNRHSVYKVSSSKFETKLPVFILNQEILEEFFFYLRNEMQLSGATVNKAMSCGSKAIKYLVAKKALSSNPFEGVRRFNPEEEKRGIPTEAEVAKLLTGR